MTDGYQAVQAYLDEHSSDVAPEVGAALSRLQKIQWAKQLAENGYERTRMSPELSEALRNEIRRTLDNDGKPFDIVTARRVYDLAIAARDMCLAATTNVKEAIDQIKDTDGPMETTVTPGTPATQAQAAETFGARLLRELLAVMRPTQVVTSDESPLDLVHALAEARRNGMTDVAAELEKRLLGKTLDGDKPIAPVIDVPEGSFEHGFADGKCGALPTELQSPDYKRGYHEGTTARFLDGARDVVAMREAFDDPNRPPPVPDPDRFYKSAPETTARGGVVQIGGAVEKLDDGPQCAKKGTCQCFDGCGSCDGCGRWLGDEETPVAHDPPLCAACLKNPDPRGGSACFDCREIRAHRGGMIKHAFKPRVTDHFKGPVGATCEYCGYGPRSSVHDLKSNSLSLDEAERLYKENLGY